MTRHGTFLLSMVTSRMNGVQHAAIANWLIGIITAVVGIWGVVRNNTLPYTGEFDVQLPVAFGLTLAAFVVLRFYIHVRCAAVPASSTFYAISRQLTRCVYLAIYLLIGANEILAVLNKGDPETSASRLWGYLIAAIMAICLIRVVALLAEGGGRTHPVSPRFRQSDG